LLAILEKGPQLQKAIPGILTEEIRVLEVEVLSQRKDPTAFSLCLTILNNAIDCTRTSTSEERLMMTASNQLQDWNLWKKMVDTLERIEDVLTRHESVS
jgi:hypothetical protein